jgi:pyruvate ferredoxin oxidoreductase alpha subunit
MDKALSADHAVAWAVRLARAEVIPAFPITPQTLIMEQLAEFIADGEMNADLVPAESEHSVMSVAIGASAGGVRTFTATSSQGLALMHEMLYAVPQNRLPIVMVNVNRSLGAASGIWLEHNDSMAERDSGWIQVYVETAQEALDMVLIAYRLAEDPRVMLPVMVCLDGFVLSHMVEKVEVPSQEEVDDFLIEFWPRNMLDPESPSLLNPIVPPEHAMEMRRQLDDAMAKSLDVAEEIEFIFREKFDRCYGCGIEEYNMDDAEYAVICLGTAAGTAKEAVDRLRHAGEKVGMLRLRYMRPFPHQQLAKACADLKALGVFDRSISFDGKGPLYAQVASSLYGSKLPLSEHIGGLGGRDVTVKHFLDIFELVREHGNGGKTRQTTWHGLRGSP